MDSERINLGTHRTDICDHDVEIQVTWINHNGEYENTPKYRITGEVEIIGSANIIVIVGTPVYSEISVLEWASMKWREQYHHTALERGVYRLYVKLVKNIEMVCGSVSEKPRDIAKENTTASILDSINRSPKTAQ